MKIAVKCSPIMAKRLNFKDLEGKLIAYNLTARNY